MAEPRDTKPAAGHSTWLAVAFTLGWLAVALALAPALVDEVLAEAGFAAAIAVTALLIVLG